MANVKYVIREFVPTPRQTGTHSFFAQSQPDNVITNRELASKIEARGISRASEIKMILEEAAKIILEEVGENNRVQLETGDGGVLVTIYPKVTGSISDTDVTANPDKYDGKTVAEESRLTADMLTWTLGAQVGKKYSKQFALNKRAQKVSYKPSAGQEDVDDDNAGGDNGNQGGNGNSGNQGGIEP